MKWIIKGVEDIVLATDFSECAHVAFHAAIRAARLFGARLHILHVNEEEAVLSGYGSDALITFLQGIALKRLQWLAELEGAAQACGVEARAATASGPASQGIARFAEEVGAGLVVIGLSGANASHHLIAGSTSLALIRNIHRPMLLVRADTSVSPAEEGGSYNHVVYPTDLTDVSKDGLPAAEAVAARAGAKLTLVHIARLPTLIPAFPGEPPISVPISTVNDPTAELTGELEAVLSRTRLTDVSTVIDIDMRVAHGIARVVDRERGDLLVVPRHSKRGPRSWLFGRTAETLLKVAPVPVLVFDPPEASD